MKKKMKTNQIIIKMTEKQKDFFLTQSKKEHRTITEIINIAVSEKYPEYKNITECVGENNE